MNIFLVDDNQPFRKSLKLFIEDFLNYKVIGEASNGTEFLNKIDSTADVILMDINMPEMNGLEATKYSIWKNFHLKIIAVSQYRDSVDLKQLIEAGFRGYVSKTNLFDELEKAINTVHEEGYFFPEEMDV